MSKYSQQAVLVPGPGGGRDSVSFPVATLGALLGPLLDTVTEAVEFSDALPHVVCEFDVLPARTNVGVVFLSAHDDAGNQIAFVLTGFTVTRFGAGPILVFGTPLPAPLPITFIPGGPAWTVNLVEATPGKLGIEVTDVGSTGVPVLWKSTVVIFGTQAK